MRHAPVAMWLVFAVATGCGDDGEATGADAATTVDASFDAAVATGPIRILPLGDSLTLGFGTATEGAGTEVGYRLRLLERLGDESVEFEFVGSNSNGPQSMSDRDHEGYNGYTIAQVTEVAGPAIEAHAPDAVLLLAGTNDLLPPSQPPVDAAADFEELIEALHTQSPGIHIIAGQVIPLVFNDAGVLAYNDLLPAIVERQDARGVNIRLVDHYAIGLDALSNDGVHPTQAGYDAMADIWLPAALEVITELDR